MTSSVFSVQSSEPSMRIGWLLNEKCECDDPGLSWNRRIRILNNVREFEKTNKTILKGRWTKVR